MTPRAVVIDTNVLVAGVITRDPESPTAQAVDGMLAGRFVFLISTALLDEYRRVLLRPSIQKLHGLDETQIDVILTELVANAVVREPEPAVVNAPEPADQHLWDLLGHEEGAVLVTGDGELLRRPPADRSVISPATFAALRAS